VFLAGKRERAAAGLHKERRIDLEGTLGQGLVSVAKLSMGKGNEGELKELVGKRSLPLAQGREGKGEQSDGVGC